MHRTVAEHQDAVEQVLRRSWAAFPSPVMDDGGTPVPLSAARGRVLARALAAGVDLPPFANSQMDGYAINVGEDQLETADSGQSTVYVVGETIAAGAVPGTLAPGTAAAIMTGAMLPDGANAVVPVERAVPALFAEPGATVELPATSAGQFVRDRGSDVARGSLAIAAGTVLNAAHLGLAAALGCTELVVRRRARVLLLTTGDEVLAPGDPAAAGGLPPGKIFDANGALLRAALEESGVEVLHHHMVSDDPAALLRLLESQVGQVPGHEGPPEPSCDLVVTVGGISAGAFEVVRLALGSAGAQSRMEFLHVALQPGGPQGLGTFRGVPVLAFPGNPVSSYVSLELFLRPALTVLLGAPAPRRRVVATLEHALSSPAGKHQVRRGIYSGPEFESAPSVREVGGSSSHLLGSLAQADALIHIPAGSTELQAGAKVEVWLL
ncbi:molybdopterin molybdotransferase [Arthrobacter stackebrandtii]|uniref:Molybdopterin molybdenumtransferase n=1 Tax=Arthrobacter stackebrandtii TaxID=272161 RepID=A0ABS4YR97_9MICC|nr:gephyrin-like molybdotransferase Glp [Arthrobacter stackebrandtii]MBP2411284.1 molybdopterin molybdotransferase [Arthrobacter stackebrandtii]PYH00192.1 molybdopterin molybdenumtransferase MoeA [Arthrobacter stackebrandtii]